MGPKPITASVARATIYVATGENDQTEGRGGQRTLGQFISESAARTAAAGEGVMGTDGYVQTVHALVASFLDPETGEVVMYKLSSKPILTKYEDPRALRASAIAKLTAKEKKALGL